MCGRYTYKLTWEEIVALYRLTLDQTPRNIQPRYNVCPTTDVDVVVSADGKRSLIPMRWGLIAAWWNKPLKELKLATFNARAESIATKPMFATRSRGVDASCQRAVITSGNTSPTKRSHSPGTSRGPTDNRSHSRPSTTPGPIEKRTRNCDPFRW